MDIRSTPSAPAADPAADPAAAGDPTVAIVGSGRLGTALVDALRDAGLAVRGPFGRGYDGAAGPAGAVDLVLLCVPDREIPAAASTLTPRPGTLVGHCSGATTLSPLAAHEAFSLHPLMTIPREGAQFRGAVAAVAGTSARALAGARMLADALGMTAVQVHDEDRVAYHAAAAVASNQLLAVLELAEQLAATSGLDREHLGPIVQATVRNWLATGARRALTGPVVRGDEEVIAGHRNAVATRCAVDLGLYDELLAATRRLAETQRGTATDGSPGGAPTHRAPADGVPFGTGAGSGDTDHSIPTDDRATGQAGGHVSEGDR